MPPPDAGSCNGSIVAPGRRYASTFLCDCGAAPPLSWQNRAKPRKFAVSLGPGPVEPGQTHAPAARLDTPSPVFDIPQRSISRRGEGKTSSEYLVH